jgi:hypothetical protein
MYEIKWQIDRWCLYKDSCLIKVEKDKTKLEWWLDNVEYQLDRREASRLLSGQHGQTRKIGIGA